MEPQPQTVLELFASNGAYLKGHFRLTSGLHSSQYLQCALVLQHPAAAEDLGRRIAAVLQPHLSTLALDAVVAPALGGLIIGHEMARACGVRFLFTERDPEGKMTLRRGFAVTPGQRFVVIEDVVTTGGSTREVVELLRAAGGEVLAAASIIDRSGGGADVGVPRVALETLAVDSFPPESCPLCASGLPVVKPGSRAA